MKELDLSLNYFNDLGSTGPNQVKFIFTVKIRFVIFQVTILKGESTFPYMEKLEVLVMDRCDIRTVAEVPKKLSDNDNSYLSQQP